MGLYFPKFEDVFVFRNSIHADRFATLILREEENLRLDPPRVVIDGVAYDYDEHGTERTRMTMRVHAQHRAEGSSA